MASLRKRGRSWYVRYRDEHGKQAEVKAGPDQSVARRIAAELEGRVLAIKSGAIDPRERSWADAERKPLTIHVEEWHAGLTAKGRSPRHADASRDRAQRLIDMSKAFRISHLSLSSIQTAVGNLRSLPGRSGNVGLSDRSVFHHVRAIKMFTKWLWRDGRVREDPLAHLSPPTVVHKRERQALSPEEAATLIATTLAGAVSYELTGEDRAILYALALGTGFRANELRHLTPEDFDLDGDLPTVRCRAAYAKNRTEAIQPIRPDLAAILAPWVAQKAPGKPLFGLLSGTAKMIRRDLAAAGLPQTYDFHCLRHSFISHLVQSGTPIKVVQTLARHADPAITLGVYTHVQVFDLARGLERLPALTLAPCQTTLKTGTHGNTFAHVLPTTPVSEGRDGSHDTLQKKTKMQSQRDPTRQASGSSEPRVRGSSPLGCTQLKPCRILDFGYQSGAGRNGPKLHESR
jgi:integrase